MKPKCAVVDLDGTFALHSDPKRSDHSNCINDEVNQDVIEGLEFFCNQGQIVIFLTKRSTKYQIETISWLNENFNGNSFLLMRDDSDTDDSPTFKKKKLKKLLEYFDIDICFEDDDRNIKMMRELGLKVIDVKI